MYAILQVVAAVLGAVLNLLLAYQAYMTKKKAWKVVVPAVSAIAFLATSAVRAGLIG
ncbi:hypothetical protein [Novosphingobium sp. 17-62-19]|uniref:hypothetical protein n=1 Tax=Novosphingobium sp. 17-62-19 TaxID=1970406 RepID=UPI0025DA10F4|nr:hypothetical protein [Novosphingobium sp. 17-62-19]HQS98159.1 hypothetical protein [Novosphingobium sp.]